ncbi:MAG: NADH-quinone oxidoreductase subunit L [Deltaproteobacteria bacterium]|nr:NADH-quinone oxidoreductase subunit L [Deltaproteobacteria bacterium]
MLLYNPVLIIIAPLLSALINALLGKSQGKIVFRLGLALHVVAVIVALQIIYKVVTVGPQTIDLSFLLGSGSGLFNLVFYIDRLAAVMMVLISIITATIFIFSMNYMREESDYPKFNVLLSFTTAILFCMVSSPNLLLIFIFWQLMSFMLYLLSYQYTDHATMKGAFKTFMTLRFGDIAFLAGIALAYNIYGTLELKEIFSQVPGITTTYSLGPWFTIHANTAITLLIFVGAMSKSAQFPLHIWVRDALYAPTPMHALLHAGIINAGGFLINRLAPLYGSSPATLHVVLVIGLLTVIIGSSMMLVQNNIKRTLGYSTIGQMGFMILECGVGAFALAIFHLIAHGLFKATIFLNCGNIIHKARLEPKFPYLTAKDKDPELESEEDGFSFLTWLTGFVLSLVLPLVILLVAHGALRLPLMESQGALVFLFFSWVTSSRAIMAIYKAQTDTSFSISIKLSILMFITLVVIVFVYLFAVESFTYFLYPDHNEVAAYFHAASLPSFVFDTLIVAVLFYVVFKWSLNYLRAHGRKAKWPSWVSEFRAKLYILLVNKTYTDNIYAWLHHRIIRFANLIEKRYLRFLP